MRRRGTGEAGRSEAGRRRLGRHGERNAWPRKQRRPHPPAMWPETPEMSRAASRRPAGLSYVPPLPRLCFNAAMRRFVGRLRGMAPSATVRKVCKSSATQAEAADHRRVAIIVRALEVVEQAAAAADQHQQSAPAVEILGVDLEMLGKAGDAIGD